MFFNIRGGLLILQSLKIIPRKDIECTRCHQILPITEFPPEYVLRNKKNPLCRKCKKEKQKALRERWAKERAIRTDLPTEKECRGCHQFKPISEFNICVRYKEGLHSNCKSCVIKKSQELKKRWKKERKQTKLPEEKLCTQCYHIFPIAHFCNNKGTKDGFDNICKVCQRKQRNKYATRWIQERKIKTPKKKKRCPGCNRTLPVSEFYLHKAIKDGLSNYCIECSKRIRKKYSEKWEQKKELTKKGPKTKECSICHRILALDKFYQNRLYKDGYSGTCIACEKRRSKEYIRQWEKEETIPNEKQCHICKQILPADHFVRNKRKKDGLNYTCKKCSKQIQEKYNLRWSKERKSKTKDEFTLFPTFEKTCIVCHEAKPLSMFYTRKNSKDGYNSSCKGCSLKKMKKYQIRIKKQHKKVPKEKRCNKCKQLLPSSEFQKSSFRNDGLDLYCKKCKNQMRKEYLQRPEVEKKIKEYRRQYYKKPEVRINARKQTREYYQRPYVKAKAAEYRKKHRAKLEVKRQRQQYNREYYKRKKSSKVN